MIAKVLLLSTFGAIVSAATTTSSSPTTASSTASSTSSASSSTSPGSSASTNPFIPSSLSPGCQTALGSINSDSSLATCTGNINSVLSAFNPATGSVTTGDVDGAISKLCTSGQVAGCTADKIRSLLTTLENGCQAELSASSPTADQKMVAYQYDMLYAMYPMIGAICAIDTTTKKSCLMEIVSGTAPAPGGSSTDVTDGAANSTTTVNNSTSKATSSGSFDFKQYVDQTVLKAGNLYLTMDSSNEGSVMNQIFSGSSSNKRASSDSSDSVAIPNTALFSQAAIPFLFLSTDMPASVVCTQCTQTLLMQYFQFQQSHPYVSGIQSSVILSKETDFYGALSGMCGAGFVNSISQAAEGTNGAGRIGLGLGALVGLVGLAAFI